MTTPDETHVDTRTDEEIAADEAYALRRRAWVEKQDRQGIQTGNGRQITPEGTDNA